MATGGAWIYNLPPGYTLAQMRAARRADADLVHGRCSPIRGRVLDALYRPSGAPSTPSAAMPRRRALAGISRRRTAVQVFLIHGAFAGHRRRSCSRPSSGDPVDRAAQPRAHHHHRLGRRRGQHPRRHRLGVGSTLAAILLAAIGCSLIFLNVSPYWLEAVHRRADPGHRAGRLWRRRRQVGRDGPPEHRHQAGHPVAAGLAAGPGGRAGTDRWPWRCSIMAFTSEQFFTVDNLLNQARLMTEVGLVALPMTLIIVTGGIDLSVGSTLGLSRDHAGRAAGRMSACRSAGDRADARRRHRRGPGQRLHHHPLPRAAADRHAGTLALYRGLAEGISQARSVRGYPDWFFVLGQGNVLGVPTQLWLLGDPVTLVGAIILGTHHLRPHALRHRQQRDRGALLRPGGRPHQARDLLRPRGLLAALAGGDLRLARLDHPLGHGHRPRARRHHGRRPRRHLDLRRHAARSSAPCSGSS